MQNYRLFYNTEIMLRKQLKYPPFCDIIVIGISAENKEIAFKVTEELHKYLKNRVINENIGIMLYKGMPAPVDKIKNKYRFRIIIKCKFGNDTISLINYMINEYSKPKEGKNGIARLSNQHLALSKCIKNAVAYKRMRPCLFNTLFRAIY